MRLLITRPEPQGERTAAALRARGHDVVLAPLLRIEPITDADIGRRPWAAALITSANAVRFLPSHPRRVELLALRLLAVGQRTAEAAREAGFNQLQSADGDADDLVELVKRAVPAPGPLLYLAGADRARDTAGQLADAGYRIDTAIVYRAHQATQLPAAVAQALREGTIEGVLHFSKRTADAFLTAAAGSNLSLNTLRCHHFCLSGQIAEAFQAKGVARIAVAARPEEAAVLALVDKAL